MFCYENTSDDKELEEEIGMTVLKGLKRLNPNENSQRFQVNVKPHTMELIVYGHTLSSFSYSYTTSYGLKQLFFDKG